MKNIFVVLNIVLHFFSIYFNTAHASDYKYYNKENMKYYISIGAERYKWKESVESRDHKYVAEKGPRFRIKVGADNYLDTQSGFLKAWDMGGMFGIVAYNGSTLDDQSDIPNGSLKGKSYYTGYNAEMTRGYRYKATEAISVDVKGAVGGQIWLRNIRSEDAYIASLNTTRQFKAVEVSVQPFATTSLATNWQMTTNASFTLEGGLLYPIKTWTHSNQGNVWLEPKSKISPFTSLTWHINEKIFIKASYLSQRYGKSSVRKGELKEHTVGYYQPETKTSAASLDVGCSF